MSTPEENTDGSETPIFHPFPEPSTMPSGWDLSGFTSNPQPTPAAPADDAPED